VKSIEKVIIAGLACNIFLKHSLLVKNICQHVAQARLLHRCMLIGGLGSYLHGFVGFTSHQSVVGGRQDL
jgi:hypothetical protein